MSSRRFLTTGLGIVGFVTCGYIIFELTTPGGFSKWSHWSSCSKTCGEGLETRSRSCSAPEPGIFGLGCEGTRTESRKCSGKPCPRDGGYSEWGKFGDCDKKCGGGKRIRKRTCSNPLPLYGGRTCQHLGVPEETQTCNIQPCPVNGGYSEWGNYTECRLEGGESCGKGKKVRIRTCNNPVPQHGGKSCEGPDKEIKDCEIPCPTLKQSNATISISSTNAPNVKSA